VTDRIRVGTYVLNNDFRHPLLVAQEAASVDLLSDGRLLLGLGAGWNIPEYTEAGIPFDGAGTRIARLEESVTILKRLFAGHAVTFNGDHYTITEHTLEPAPPQGAALPILIGGNGDKLLAVAARHADIVGFTGFTIRPEGVQPGHVTRAGLDDRIEHVRHEAGERFAGIELNLLVQRAEITDDRAGRAGEIATEMEGPSAEEILDSPFVQLGTVDEIATDLLSLRQDLGVSSFTVFDGRSKGFDGVVTRLAGS
jgi:probable F420-dependent oxidoreductase